MVYLDSSAIVKLIAAEAESAALRTFLRKHPSRAASALAKVEVMRAVRLAGAPARRRARLVLRRLDLVRLDDEVLNDAASLDAAILRSLDAIHLAAARVFGDDLEAVVTYDVRMARAAALVGLPVSQPR